MYWCNSHDSTMKIMKWLVCVCVSGTWRSAQIIDMRRAQDNNPSPDCAPRAVQTPLITRWPWGRRPCNVSRRRLLETRLTRVLRRDESRTIFMAGTSLKVFLTPRRSNLFQSPASGPFSLFIVKSSKVFSCCSKGWMFLMIIVPTIGREKDLFQSNFI